MLKFQRIRLLIERVSNENAELMARQRTPRQQHANLDSFEVKTPCTPQAQDHLEVILLSVSKLKI